MKGEHLVGLAALERGDAAGAARTLGNALELARKAGGMSSAERDTGRSLQPLSGDVRRPDGGARGGAARGSDGAA